MTDATRGLLLEGAARIGQRLVQTALWDQDACSWSISTIDTDRPDGYTMIPTIANGTLYQGSAGIGLFLAELWRITRERSLLVCARGAMRHAVREDATPLLCSLYSGAVGVAYVASRLVEITGDDEWAFITRSVVDRVRSAIPTRTSGDVITGSAGALLGLLHLPQHLVGSTALDAAMEIGEQLARDAVVHPYGWSWEFGGWSVKQHLCGYSHGASGYAHAFLELFAVTGDARWHHGATRAIEYERRHRDVNVRGDWPDFRDMKLWNWARSTSDGIKLREQFRTADVAPSPINAMRVWCHGAPGIGMVRLRAVTLGVDAENCREEALDAFTLVATTLDETIPRGYSVCHGVLGNAEVLLHAERIAGWQFGDIAREAALVGVEQFELKGIPWPSGIMLNAPEPSLMLGDAGIGLVLLQLTDPAVPSASFLSGWTPPVATQSGDIEALRMKDAMTFLRRYSLVASRLGEQAVPATLQAALDAGASTPERTLDAITTAISTIPCARTASLLADALAPDAARLREHIGFDDYRSQRIAELRALAADEIEWDTARIGLAPETRIVTTQWAWRSWLESHHDDSAPPELQDESWILYRWGSQIILKPLGAFEALVMELMREPVTMDELYARVEAAADFTDRARHDLIPVLRDLVRNAVIAGIARAHASESRGKADRRVWRAPIRVGVVDSGWDDRVADGRVSSGCAFVDDDGLCLDRPSIDHRDRFGHGTRCTRLILDTAQDIQIVPMRIFNRALETSAEVLYAALEWAERQRFDVLNLSLATSASDTRDRLYWLINRLRDRGTLVVAAACNETGAGYPAIFDTVIGVGLNTDTMATQPQTPFELDVRIPIRTFRRHVSHRYGRVSNSLAAAFVSGLLAQLIERHGRLDIDEAREYLHRQVEDLRQGSAATDAH